MAEAVLSKMARCWTRANKTFHLRTSSKLAECWSRAQIKRCKKSRTVLKIIYCLSVATHWQASCRTIRRANSRSNRSSPPRAPWAISCRGLRIMLLQNKPKINRIKRWPHIWRCQFSSSLLNFPKMPRKTGRIPKCTSVRRGPGPNLDRPPISRHCHNKKVALECSRTSTPSRRNLGARLSTKVPIRWEMARLYEVLA